MNGGFRDARSSAKTNDLLLTPAPTAMSAMLSYPERQLLNQKRNLLTFKMRKPAMANLANKAAVSCS